MVVISPEQPLPIFVTISGIFVINQYDEILKNSQLALQILLFIQIIVLREGFSITKITR